jgi:hypothetical protein
MSLARRYTTGAALGLVLAVLCAMPSAHAFYPLGAYDTTGTLKFMKWPLSEMDTNGDGDVQQGEGIPILFESGEWGFTDDQIATFMRGLDTWGNVTTSFARFRDSGIRTEDPLELQTGLDAGSVDFINYAALEFNPTDSPGSTDADALPDGTLGVTLISYALEDTPYTLDGKTYLLTGGQTIETDFVLDGDFFSDPNNPLTKFASLQGGGVVLGGYSLGLNVSPLIHAADLLYTQTTPPEFIGIIETRVVNLPNANGGLSLVGTSSSMLGTTGLVYDKEFTDSTVDLAPDDIAGVSFLYPRASQANFGSIQQEARTRSRLGAPSGKLEGAHIVAYCDVDNDPRTAPVEFTDTLTGLYELAPSRRGNFNLMGLFKQLSLPDGTLFEPTYTIVCEPFKPLSGTPLAATTKPEIYDSTNGGYFANGPNPLSFATLFSTEVFREGGNLLGKDNLLGGTPLRFDPVRNRFVSADTGLSLTQMLPNRTPMFGSKDSTCPYLVVVGETIAKTGVATKGTQFLRDVRDQYLLKTGPGLALVDAYYRAAPGAAGYLRTHVWAAAIAGGMAWTIEWAVGHRYALVLLPLLLLPVLVWLGRRRPRAARAAAATLVLLAMLLPGLSASAQELPLTQKDLVHLSKDIVSGKVIAAESKFDDKHRIVTDVTVAVDDTLKGRLNKGGNVSFKVLGGRVGAIVTYSRALPMFEKDEEVVLFLKPNLKGETTVTAGRRGKLKIETDPKTKQKVVVKPGLTTPPEPMFQDSAKAQPDSVRVKAKQNAKSAQKPPALAALDEQRVPLKDFKDQLRRDVQEDSAKK